MDTISPNIYRPKARVQMETYIACPVFTGVKVINPANNLLNSKVLSSCLHIYFNYDCKTSKNTLNSAPEPDETSPAGPGPQPRLFSFKAHHTQVPFVARAHSQPGWIWGRSLHGLRCVSSSRAPQGESLKAMPGRGSAVPSHEEGKGTANTGICKQFGFLLLTII